MSNFFRDWSAGQATPWLRTDRKTRLFTLRLSNVTDPFNADAIWNQATGGDEAMREATTEMVSRRLYQALNAHRYTTTAYRGDAPIRRTYVFSDVVIWLPTSVWRDADIDGGSDLFYMTERFRYQHQKAFADNEYYHKRPPHYAIMPHNELAKDEIVCQFGMGVFLPNRDDEQTASIQIMQEAESTDFKEWIFFEALRNDAGEVIEPPQGIKILRPVGLYAKQKMLLIANTLSNSALQSPHWIKSSDQGEIIINMHAKRPTSYGDDTYIRSEQPQRQQAKTTCRFYAVNNIEDSLTLLIDRSIANTAITPISKMANSISTQAAPFETGTMIDDDDNDTFGGLSQIDISENNQPDYLYHLQLTGIVLPKLDSLKGRGARALSHWLLYLDKTGALAQTTEDIAWLIKGERKGSQLYWKAQQADDNTWQVLELNQPLPFLKQKNHYLQSPELPSKQFAIFSLPEHSFSIPLPLNRVILGRDTQEQMGDKHQADIPLGLLNNASRLVYKNGQQRGNLSHIGLSGQHLQLKLTQRHLHIQQISRSRTYILQKQGDIRSILTLKEPETALDANESLIVGAFRFQFIESFMPDYRD